MAVSGSSSLIDGRRLDAAAAGHRDVEQADVGRCSRASATACSPSAASAHTSKPPASSDWRTPERVGAWSSAMSTRAGGWSDSATVAHRLGKHRRQRRSRLSRTGSAGGRGEPAARDRVGTRHCVQHRRGTCRARKGHPGTFAFRRLNAASEPGVTRATRQSPSTRSTWSTDSLSSWSVTPTVAVSPSTSRLSTSSSYSSSGRLSSTSLAQLCPASSSTLPVELLREDLVADLIAVAVAARVREVVHERRDLRVGAVVVVGVVVDVVVVPAAADRHDGGRQGEQAT